MKQFNLSEYDNLSTQINLSSNEIFNIIQQYPLNFIQVRDNSVEWGMQLPMFVPSFYEFILRNSNIPTQIEYFENYLSINSDFFLKNNYNPEILNE